MPEQPEPKYRASAPTLPSEIARPALPYAELDVTSNFSFLRGASHADELIFRAAEFGYSAIAVTDLNTLAGVVRMHQAIKLCKEQLAERNLKTDLKLLIGARLTLTDCPDLLVWAINKTGYTNLCRLLTHGKRRAEKGEFLLSLGEFLDRNEGLFVALSPEKQDSLNSDSYPLQMLRSAVGKRLSIAAHVELDGNDRARLAHIDSLCKQTGIAMLATNRVMYHDASRRMLQDVLTCIRHGCTIHEAGFRLLPNQERHLKTPEQMDALFAEHRHAVDRGIEIATACNFSLDELRYEYPDEVVPAGKTPQQYLTEITLEGAAERYPQGVPQNVREKIQNELRLIEQQNYAAYFLTVYDLVKFARARGILCQGRGSAANSVVCYCIGVTSASPDHIEALFERFVSAERGEPPDIDVDFEHERREEVLQYVYEKYGRDRAGMTAEIISYRRRSAVRDVGKALGFGLDAVDQLARTLDRWDSAKLTKDRMITAGLDPGDRAIIQLIELSYELQGFPRHLGQHVGGMVIARGKLCDLVPIENASMEDRTVIEWDKDDIDALGMMKVDILGLGMLTCIRKGLELINANVPPNLKKYELHSIQDEDPKVYDMICEADTVGVFQIESRAQMSMLPRLKPRRYYDLVIEVAIVRPGPIQGDMVHPYLRRRDGLEPVDYPSEALKKVLRKTLGVPLFQEQAMMMSIAAAGFSPAQADQLRRAMASWRYDGSIDKFYDQFIFGMLDNGYTREFSEQCFDQIKGFSGYGFPESHAASFAILVYASCWIKRHHPAAFCCALLNSQPMGFYAPAQIVRDAQEHSVPIRPVDVNHSDWQSTLEYNAAENLPLPRGLIRKKDWGRNGPAVRLGFDRVKGMPQAAAEMIVRARQIHGEFISIPQFKNVTGVSAAVVNRLATADAFASLQHNRRAASWQTLALHDSPSPLFENANNQIEPVPELPTMPLAQEVMTDYATTSLSLKQHPLSLVREQLEKERIITASQLREMPKGRWVKVAGIVLIRQRPGTASGVVFATIEDETGIANLIIKPDIFDRFHAAARVAVLLEAHGYVERQGEVMHVMCKRLIDRGCLLNGAMPGSRDFH